MYINFIRVPDNGAIENLSAERLEEDPSLTGLRPGRIWYNLTTNQLKFSYTDTSDGKVKIAVFLTASLLDRVDKLEKDVATNTANIDKNAKSITKLQEDLTTTQASVKENADSISAINELIGEGIVESVYKQYPYSKYTKATTVKDMLINVGKAVADIPTSFSGNIRTTTLDELVVNSTIDTSNLLLSGVKVYKGDIVASLNPSSMGLFYVDTNRYAKLDLVIEEKYGVLEGEHSGNFLVFTSLDTYEFRESEDKLVPEQVMNIHDTVTLSQTTSDTELHTSVLIGTTAFSFSSAKGLELVSPGRYAYVSRNTYIDSNGALYISGASYEGKHYSFTYSKTKKEYVRATDKGVLYSSLDTPITNTNGSWTEGHVFSLNGDSAEFILFILRGSTLKVGYVTVGETDKVTTLDYDNVFSAQMVGSELRMTVLADGVVKFVSISVKANQFTATVIGSVSVKTDSKVSVLAEHSSGKVGYLIVNGELYAIDKTTLSDKSASTMFRVQRVGEGVILGDKLIAQTGVYTLGGTV